MSEIVKTTHMTSLAEIESMIPDKDVARKVFLHTVRDYMPFFDQAAVIPGNDGKGDLGTITTTYPEGVLHGYDEGWISESPEGINARYICQRRTSSNTVDKDKLDDKPEDERATWRLRRDQAFSRGFARATVRDIFYGKPEEDPKSCRGFFNIVRPENPVFKDRIINAGGTTANKQTEIVLIGWDETQNYLFYPRNDPGDGGFRVIPHEQPIRVEKTDKDGVLRHYWAYETDFRWTIGLAIYDPLTVVRIANIDTTKWSSSTKTSGSPNLINLMTQALNMLPDEYKGRCAFYCNESVTGILRLQINNKENVMLTPGEVAGRKVMTWDGIPIHRLGTDVITNTNAVVTGL